MIIVFLILDAYTALLNVNLTVRLKAESHGALESSGWTLFQLIRVPADDDLRVRLLVLHLCKLVLFDEELM